jgi:hypothetical protein
MSIETYWLAVPLIGIGLSGFWWAALLLANWRRERRAYHPPTTKTARHA